MSSFWLEHLTFAAYTTSGHLVYRCRHSFPQGRDEGSDQGLKQPQNWTVIRSAMGLMEEEMHPPEGREQG